MSIKEVIDSLLKKDICDWKKNADQERVIAYLDNCDIRTSEYYKLGCYYCNGKREGCQYSPKFDPEQFDL